MSRPTSTFVRLKTPVTGYPRSELIASTYFSFASTDRLYFFITCFKRSCGIALTL